MSHHHAPWWKKWVVISILVLVLTGEWLEWRHFLSTATTMSRPEISQLPTASLQQSPIDSSTNTTAMLPLNTKRLHPLDLQANYSFLHIAKAAGASWITELQTVLPFKHQLYPKRPAGQEHSLAGQLFLRPYANYLLLSLKSPRHLLWSMFRMCYSSRWGKSIFTLVRTNDSMHDFETWLDHFINTTTQQPADTMENFYCYHPANPQSRILTSPAHHPTDLEHIPLATRYEPNLTQALQTVATQFDWVGFVEYYHESKCLLFYRIKSNLTMAFVDRECKCPRPNHTSDLHIQHHPHSTTTTVQSMNASLLHKMDILTRIDVPLYRCALQQFYLELDWLEHELGRKVLCEKSAELNYLWQPS